MECAGGLEQYRQMDPKKHHFGINCFESDIVECDLFHAYNLSEG